ncbi:MAG: prepilin-type N-terminal cleavage/methylation domain-containing protein [Myxococcales bacterium]|nr:MAG: prepilin-type N-terminal cleavage/methylation domain-containing protein [Myxococcales bacterium]
MTRGSRTPSYAAEGGVSLLEMLVAMAIFAIIASLLYGTFSRTAGTRRYVGERAAVYSLARSSVSWLERDIEAAFSAHTYPVGEHRFISAGRVERETTDDEIPLLDVTTVTSLGTTPLEAPGFIIEGRREQVDQARVVYRLEEPQDDDGDVYGLDLVRYDFRPARLEELEKASRAVVAHHIETVELRFFDGVSWWESWDSQRGQTNAGRAPRMVETRVTIATLDDDPLTFVSGIALAVSTDGG